MSALQSTEARYMNKVFELGLAQLGRTTLHVIMNWRKRESLGCNLHTRIVSRENIQNIPINSLNRVHAFWRLQLHKRYNVNLICTQIRPWKGYALYSLTQQQLVQYFILVLKT